MYLNSLLRAWVSLQWNTQILDTSYHCFVVLEEEHSIVSQSWLLLGCV